MSPESRSTGTETIVLRDGANATQLLTVLAHAQAEAQPERIIEREDRSVYIADRTYVRSRIQEICIDQPLPATECFAFRWQRTDGRPLQKGTDESITAVLGAVTVYEIGISAIDAAGEIVAIDKEQAKNLINAFQAQLSRCK